MFDEVASDEGAPDDEAAPAPDERAVSFDPASEPDLPPEPDDAMLPWEVVKSLHDLATSGLLAVAGTSPVLYGALESGRLAELDPSAPEDVAATANVVLFDLETNILETRENLEAGLDWHRLSPIVSELTAGKVVEGGSGVDWSAPFYTSLVSDEVGDYATIRALEELGWLIPAVALMFTPLGWPALVAGGLLSVAEVAHKYQRWDELRVAADAGATPQTELVASTQAEAAEAELILATVFGFLGAAADVGALGTRGLRPAKAGAAAGEIDAAGPGSAAATATASPAQRAEAFQSRYPKIDDGLESMDALTEAFSRAGRTGPDEYLPIHTRAHSQELKTIIRYATDPDVVRIELIASSSGARSPDLVLEIREADGTIRRTRVEITTLIGTTAGRKARGGAGASQPVVDDIVRAVRGKAKDDPAGRRSQLAVPMDDVPAGGTLAVHLPYAGADAATDIASAMDELTSFLATTPHVEAIEFFLPGARRVRYVRGAAGDYAAAQ
jgi:hypothetical protein